MPSDRVSVRPATEADAEAIAAVHVRSWQGGYRGILPDGFLAGLDPATRVPMWQRMLGRTDWPSTGALVAHRSGELIGFVHICPSRDDDAGPEVGEVTSIYVDPEAWGTGAGRGLMTAAIDRMRDAFTSATLWVLAGNERAARFYRAAGWVPEGVTKQDTIAGVPVNELRYRHTLTPAQPAGRV